MDGIVTGLDKKGNPGITVSALLLVVDIYWALDLLF
jgi:hypothetical protein